MEEQIETKRMLSKFLKFRFVIAMDLMEFNSIKQLKKKKKNNEWNIKHLLIYVFYQNSKRSNFQCKTAVW